MAFLITDTLLKLFSEGRVHFTNKAVNEPQWRVERKTYMMFVEFLEDCDSKAKNCVIT